MFLLGCFCWWVGRNVSWDGKNDKAGGRFAFASLSLLSLLCMRGAASKILTRLEIRENSVT